jgi:PhnB protein
MELNVYLNFNGDCEEALNYYKEALNGTIQHISYFKDAPMPSPETHKNKVMHATLSFGSSVIMASDGMPDHKIKFGENVSLNLNFTEEAEMEKVYKKMASGGKEVMPLQDTFWGARFGMCVDKFGVNWMFNCEKKKS